MREELSPLRIFFILIGIFLVGTLTISSAAQIGLADENYLDSTQAEACMSTTVAATTTTPGGNNLRINNISSNCIGLPLLAHVVTSNGVGEIQVSGTVTGATYTNTATPIPNPANVIGVKFTINGWNVPATWTYQNVTTGPIAPNPNTPGIVVTVTYNQTSATQVCATVNVSTTSTTPIPWSALLNTNGSPFNGDTNQNNYQINPNNPYRFAPGGAVNGVFTIQGRQPANQTVVAGSPRNFTVCNFNTPPPPPVNNPNVTYTVTQTTPVQSWFVCKTVTITTTGAPTFFVGWNTTVDVTDLRAVWNGGPTGGAAQITSGGFVLTPLGGNLYRVNGNGFNTWGIRDANPINFNICWG